MFTSQVIVIYGEYTLSFFFLLIKNSHSYLLVLFVYILGNGKGTRRLWNNGKDIVWYHIVKLVDDELCNGLKLLSRLTHEHVNLTPYAVMNVCLAVQVLSSSVSKVLTEFYPATTPATAELCMYMDSFFDCLNA